MTTLVDPDNTPFVTGFPESRADIKIQVAARRHDRIYSLSNGGRDRSHRLADDIMDIEEDPLFKAAVSELLSIKNVLKSSAQKREDNVRVFLAHAYALSMSGKRDSVKHDALRLKSRIKVRNDTPHHKQTLRALLRSLGEAPPKGSEHEWSKVLCGLEEAGIAETEEAVVRFLTEPINIGKKRVRGFARAHAALRSSERIKNEKRSRLDQINIQRQKEFYSKISSIRDDPFGVMDANEGRWIKNVVWISVNEGEDVLRKLKIPEKDMQELLLRYGVDPVDWYSPV